MIPEAKKGQGSEELGALLAVKKTAAATSTTVDGRP
jgi:hypothetical protein